MSYRILVDLSHNEQIEEFPDSAINDEIYEVEYLEEGPITSDVLEDFDVLFFGNILHTEDGKKDKFTPDELKSIKKFVGDGGGILLTTGSGGDADVPMKKGSFRVLYKITGVRRAWNGTIQEASGNFMVKKHNLICHDIFSHPITKGLTELVFPNCTFFEVAEEDEADDIVVTSEKAEFKYKVDGATSGIGPVPICVVSKFSNGRALTIGSSDFLLEDSDFGIDAGDNLKFFDNCLKWLTFEL